MGDALLLGEDDGDVATEALGIVDELNVERAVTDVEDDDCSDLSASELELELCLVPTPTPTPIATANTTTMINATRAKKNLRGRPSILRRREGGVITTSGALSSLVRPLAI